MQSQLLKKSGYKVSTLIILGIYILFVFITPQLLEGYTMMVVNLALIYSIIAYGISVMLGMGGHLLFSGVAFMGGGAFFVANLCAPKRGIDMPTLPALLLTIPVFIIISFIFGLILLRLSGTYFTFSTIALVQVFFTIFNNYKPLFGGADGISGVPTLNLFGYTLSDYNQWFYFLAFIVLLVAIFVQRVRSTPLGRSLASVRDNETAALTLGVNVYMTKVIAFTIAGTLSAFAGALYCLHGRYVAADMFTYATSTQYIIMAMLGGVNSPVGPFIGSMLVSVLPEVLRGFERYFQLFWGISIVLLMVFIPTGLAGLVEHFIAKLKKKNKISRNNQGEGSVS